MEHFPSGRCVSAVSAFELNGFEKPSMTHRVSAWIVKALPATRRPAAFYRLDF